MADPVKVYREVQIDVGMGEYPTNFKSAVIDVMTENDIVKLLVTFPERYVSYRKILDIGYTTASEVYTVESYEMTYKDELDRYWFNLGRRFTYGEKAYLQFRCLYSDGQESVDAAILKLKFRPALRTEDFESYENNDLETQSEILEKLVIQHANVNASTRHTGHVAVDQETIIIDDDGVISAQPFVQVVRNPDDFIMSITGTGDIQSNKSVLDSDGYIHGVFSYNNKMIYYTNKNVTSTTKTRIFPLYMAAISELNPNTAELDTNWIGRSISDEQTGHVIKYDTSSIPNGVNITKSELVTTISSVDVDGGTAYPKAAEVRLIGKETVQASWNREATISGLQTSTPDDPNYTDGYYHSAGILNISVWNSLGDPETSGKLDVYNGLVAFDFESLLPSNAIVKNAILELTVDSTYNADDRILEIYKINSFWDQDVVYWEDKPAMESTITNTFVEAFSGTISIDVTSDVVSIMLGSSANNGWYINYENETLPLDAGYGYQINFSDARLVITYLTSVPWNPKTVTWNAIQDKIFDTYLGTFAATGPWNRQSVDITDQVIEWIDTPEDNNGIYIITSTLVYDGRGFNIFNTLFNVPGDFLTADWKTDFSGRVPYLLVEYDNNYPTQSIADVWRVEPIYDDSLLNYSIYPDITVTPGGVVHIILPLQNYNGVTLVEPLMEGSIFSGYLDIKIVDDNRSIQFIKSVDYVLDQDNGCRDPKITAVSTGTVYAFIKKIDDNNPSSRIIEVYSNNSSPWTLEYSSSEVIPQSYTYTTGNTKRYMGGQAVSVDSNAYCAYLSHSEEMGVNPDTGSTDNYLSFSVNVINNESGWQSEEIYTYEPMFPSSGIYSTYDALSTYSARGYPFGYRYYHILFSRYITGSELFLLNMAADTESDMVVLVPTWSRYERSGIPDMIMFRYDGENWIENDLRLNDWDATSREYTELTSIMPDSIIYDSDKNIRITYKIFAMPTNIVNGAMTPIKYAKYDSLRWIMMDKISDVYSYSDNPFGYGRTNLLQLPNGSVIAMCKTWPDPRVPRDITSLLEFVFQILGDDYPDLGMLAGLLDYLINYRTALIKKTLYG